MWSLKWSSLLTSYLKPPVIQHRILLILHRLTGNTHKVLAHTRVQPEGGSDKYRVYSNGELFMYANTLCCTVVKTVYATA